MATLTVPATPKPIIALARHQKALIESNERFQWANWARQAGGKSFAFSLRRLIRGIRRRRDQIFMSAGERQCKKLMTMAQKHLQALQIACPAETIIQDAKLTSIEIKIPGLISILGIPANPDTARGFTGDVLLDEFAIHATDREIWAAMMPTITRGDGEIDVCSTPKGKRNMFYLLRDNPLFRKSTVSVYDAIAGGVDANAEIMRQLCTDPDIWRQEFLCQFIDGASDYLPTDAIATAATVTDWQRTAASLAKCRRDLYVGVDIGRKHDLTVIWVISRDGLVFRTELMIVLCKAPFRIQREEIARVMRLPKVRHACIDETGVGMQLAEETAEMFGRRRVTPFTFTQSSKSNIAAGVRDVLVDQRFAIPDNEAVISDFQSIEKAVTRHGNIVITSGHGTDGHADRFWAAALAVHAALGASPCKVAIAAVRSRKLMVPRVSFVRRGFF